MRKLWHGWKSITPGVKGIQRGLEARETLRVNGIGTLATTGHPEALGLALTHKWITTADFCGSLLEFIT